MSDQHDFDELARRKLEERRFSPQEADWLAAQRLINAARPADRKRRAFILFAILALLGGAGWWFASRPFAVKDGVATVVERKDHSDAVEGRSVPKDLTTAQEATDNAASVVERSTLATPNKVEVSAPKDPGSQKRAEGSSHPGNVHQLAASRPERRTEVATARNDDAPFIASTITDESLNTDGANDATNKGNRALQFAIDHLTDGPSQADAGAQGSNTGSTSVPSTRTDTTDGKGVTIQADDQVVPDPADDYFTVSDTNSFTTTRDTVPLTGIINPSADSTTATNDTTRQAPMPRSPWEISALGGGLLSTSTYTGGTSDLWSAGSTGRWAPAFGVEAMRMGRHFGIGGGVHHITYAEDLDVGSQSTTTMVIRDSNYFQSVDTTLFIVTGTTQIDGQTYYITQPFQTTVQILINGTATSISTQELVRAMKAANRISYLEIPLLGDAHLVRGAWSFGVRGGPTVGLLTSRSASLPTTISDGSLVNTERTFKSTVFGVTGRAYLRYRFNSSWALGAEPMYRMQFGSALESGDLVRRNAGWGGLLSLSYQLR